MSFLGFGAKEKPMTQFTTVTLTNLGTQKADTTENQDKFKMLDCLRDENAPMQIVDISRQTNIPLHTCVKTAREMKDGGWIRSVNQNENQ